MLLLTGSGESHQMQNAKVKCTHMEAKELNRETYSEFAQ